MDDSFSISCREENENIKENFMFDDLIFSLTGKGKIVGIQIKNVSQLLSESGVDFDDLDSIKDVSLIVLPKENSFFIGIILLNKENVRVQLPLGRIYLPQLNAI